MVRVVVVVVVGKCMVREGKGFGVGEGVTFWMGEV